MATPASRALAPRPPEKGVFPLDHFEECKEVRWLWETRDLTDCLRKTPKNLLITVTGVHKLFRVDVIHCIGRGFLHRDS